MVSVDHDYYTIPWFDRRLKETIEDWADAKGRLTSLQIAVEFYMIDSREHTDELLMGWVEHMESLHDEPLIYR